MTPTIPANFINSALTNLEKKNLNGTISKHFTDIFLVLSKIINQDNQSFRCNREYIKNLSYTDVTFPVAQKDYRKIEIMNNIDISVFGYEKQEPYPVYISKEKFNDMLNLLLITKGKE